MLYATLKSRQEVNPQHFHEKLISLRGIVGMLLLFIFILSGILSGIFSPIEVGAIGVVGAFIYSLIRRRITWKLVMLSLEDTLAITSKLLLILIGVGILGYYLAATRLPFTLAESFLHTLKTQLIYHISFYNFGEAKRILFKYIEIYYYQIRKFSANGWKAAPTVSRNATT